MAGKTDIVTGPSRPAGRARRENFQLRPIMLLNKEHSLKLVGLVGKPPAGDPQSSSSGVTVQTSC